MTSATTAPLFPLARWMVEAGWRHARRPMMTTVVASLVGTFTLGSGFAILVGWVRAIERGTQFKLPTGIRVAADPGRVLSVALVAALVVAAIVIGSALQYLAMRSVYVAQVMTEKGMEGDFLEVVGTLPSENNQSATWLYGVGLISSDGRGEIREAGGMLRQLLLAVPPAVTLFVGLLVVIYVGGWVSAMLLVAVLFIVPVASRQNRRASANSDLHQSLNRDLRTERAGLHEALADATAEGPALRGLVDATSQTVTSRDQAFIEFRTGHLRAQLAARALVALAVALVMLVGGPALADGRIDVGTLAAILLAGRVLVSQLGAVVSTLNRGSRYAAGTTLLRSFHDEGPLARPQLTPPGSASVIGVKGTDRQFRCIVASAFSGCEVVRKDPDGVMAVAVDSRVVEMVPMRAKAEHRIDTWTDGRRFAATAKELEPSALYVEDSQDD